MFYVQTISEEFELSCSLKSIFRALVRSIVEYGSVVWSLSGAEISDKPERVRRSFLRTIKYAFNVDYPPPHDYNPLSISKCSSSTTVTHIIFFLQKLFSGSGDSPLRFGINRFTTPDRNHPQ